MNWFRRQPKKEVVDDSAELRRSIAEGLKRENKSAQQIADLQQRNGLLLKQINILQHTVRATEEERRMLLDARYDRREADVLLLCARIAMKVITGGTPTPQEYQDRVMLGQWLKGRNGSD